ncbi:MAG: prolyl oligopeptidase family serine peptidase [Candidatus Hydrogenedentes bacterium]|nr:prolyl oligopeptidase family serine peptidase [Candidatus Hydrogenedentota bacterium]
MQMMFQYFFERVLLVSVLFLGTCEFVSKDHLFFNGQVRSFEIHAPSDLPAAPVPLVIALHQFTGTGRQMRLMTGFNAIADREKFVVVYPDGLERSWNYELSGVTAMIKTSDDEGFLLALIEHLEGRYRIDPGRIYLTGASNGAMLTQTMACRHANLFAAIAPVMGSMEWETARRSAPVAPMPTLLVHGTADPIVPFEGGLREEVIRNPNYLSAGENADWWAEHNGCSNAPVVERYPDKVPDDGTRLKVYRYEDCGEAEVLLYCVEGAGHTWPGSPNNAPEPLVGKTSYEFSASEAIWSFFSRHRRAVAQEYTGQS